MSETNKVSRNEPCPCGSGKKYKRCHGIDAPPVLSEKKQDPAAFGGMDPNALDPEMVAQFSKMISRLPKGQLNKLQSLMQKTMAGKDVSADAKDFESGLPLEMQQMLMSPEFTAQFEAAKSAAGENLVEAPKESKMKKFFSKLTGKSQS